LVPELVDVIPLLQPVISIAEVASEQQTARRDFNRILGSIRIIRLLRTNARPPSPGGNKIQAHEFRTNVSREMYGNTAEARDFN